MEAVVLYITELLNESGVSEVELDSSSQFGDYAFSCFKLAKEKGNTPIEIAKELAGIEYDPNILEKIEAKGPYVNFFINKEYFFKNLKIGEIKKDDETIVIEFSSPNTNKPLHLGHIRNIVIGDSLSRMLKATKKRLAKTCVVNDRGVHICKSMLAYQKFGEGKTPESENVKSDHFVGDYYVRYDIESKKNPSMEDEVKDMLIKWEKSDNEVIKLWKLMNSWVYKGFEETYKKLGIKFDKTYYESNMYDKGKEIIEKGLKDNKLRKDDKGNIVSPLSDFKQFNNDKVLLRSDGTTVYMTQDLFLAIEKFKDFKFDKSIYVVGSEQKMHFMQLFKTLDLLGLINVENLYHLSYGMVNLPDGKMKSREGTVVDADDLIEQMVNLAEVEVKKRYEDLDDSEISYRSNVIGLGALKFFILKHDHNKDMTYNPKESINFEGETGPYVQYSYARIKSILRKAGVVEIDENFTDITDKEFLLAKKIDEFNDSVLDSVRQYKPSILCRYLIDLCQVFNNFYSDHQILKEKEDVKNKRLFLIKLVSEVISKGLDHLGIDVLEEM